MFLESYVFILKVEFLVFFMNYFDYFVEVVDKEFKFFEPDLRILLLIWVFGHKFSKRSGLSELIFGHDCKEQTYHYSQDLSSRHDNL